MRASPWRKRQDSLPVSMMCARWVMRSTTAFASRASGKTLVHSPNGRLVVTISDGALVALGDDLEDELGGAVGEREVAELVKDDELGAGVAGDDAAELSSGLGCLQLVRERGEGGEADAASLLAGEHREGDREMCLAGPAVAEEDDGLAVIDPGALRERGDRGLGDLRVLVEAEVLQALGERNRASMSRRRSRRSARSVTSASKSAARYAVGVCWSRVASSASPRKRARMSGGAARGRARRSVLPSLGPSPGRSSTRSRCEQLVVVAECRRWRPEPGQARGEIIKRPGFCERRSRPRPRPRVRRGHPRPARHGRPARPRWRLLAGEHQHVDHLPGGLRGPVALGDLPPQLIEDGWPGAALALLGESDRPGQRTRLASEQLQIVVQ